MPISISHQPTNPPPPTTSNLPPLPPYINSSSAPLHLHLHPILPSSEHLFHNPATMPSTTRATLLGLIALFGIAATMVPRSDAQISCPRVFSSLSPCLDYLTDGKDCTPSCCKGVSNLKAAARSKSDKQLVCGCLKKASSQIAGVDLSRAAELPKHCKLQIPYKISPNTNCDEIK